MDMVSKTYRGRIMIVMPRKKLTVLFSVFCSFLICTSLLLFFEQDLVGVFAAQGRAMFARSSFRSCNAVDMM